MPSHSFCLSLYREQHVGAKKLDGIYLITTGSYDYIFMDYKTTVYVLDTLVLWYRTTGSMDQFVAGNMTQGTVV